MKYEFQKLESLPALAWGAVLTKGSSAATVYTGAQVEIDGQMFVEGAWNGRFGSSSPLDSTFVCGSGGTCQRNGFSFWAGTDGIYPVHSVRRKGSLVLSNSAVFAMCLAGEAPHPAYPFDLPG